MIEELHSDRAGTVTLLVSGMTCGGCAKTVERILSRVPGATGVKVELANCSAVVTGRATPDELIAALEAAGYGGHVAPGATIG